MNSEKLLSDVNFSFAKSEFVKNTIAKRIRNLFLIFIFKMKSVWFMFLKKFSTLSLNIEEKSERVPISYGGTHIKKN